MSDLAFVKDCDPPWVAFPQIQAFELSRYLKQGVTESWFDQQWRPFWEGLTPEQQRAYLDYWQATPAWRETIASYFNPDEEFDIEADARESEEHLEQWLRDQKSK